MIAGPRALEGMGQAKEPLRAALTGCGEDAKGGIGADRLNGRKANARVWAGWHDDVGGGEIVVTGGRVGKARGPRSRSPRRTGFEVDVRARMMAGVVSPTATGAGESYGSRTRLLHHRGKF